MYVGEDWEEGRDWSVTHVMIPCEIPWDPAAAADASGVMLTLTLMRSGRPLGLRATERERERENLGGKVGETSGDRIRRVKAKMHLLHLSLRLSPGLEGRGARVVVTTGRVHRQGIKGKDTAAAAEGERESVKECPSLRHWRSEGRSEREREGVAPDATGARGRGCTCHPLPRLRATESEREMCIQATAFSPRNLFLSLSA